MTLLAFAGKCGGFGARGFVYGATLIGQGLGAEQMYLMRSLVDQACVEALDDPRRESSLRSA